MPEDDLFKNGTEPNATPTTPVQTPAAPAAGLSAEQVAEIVKSTVNTEMAGTKNSIRAIEGVFQQLQNAQAQQTAALAADPTEFAARLYSGDARNAVSEAFAEDSAPVIALTAKTNAKIVLERQRAAIDAEWGPGAWDLVHKQEIEPRIDSALANTPQALLDDAPIVNAVATVTGTKANLDKLIAHKEESTKTRTETDGAEVKKITDAVIAQTNLSGGIRRAPGEGPKLGPEYDEYLDGFFRDTGTKLDKGRVEKSMATGNTIEDYLEAHKESE